MYMLYSYTAFIFKEHLLSWLITLKNQDVFKIEVREIKKREKVNLVPVDE